MTPQLMNEKLISLQGAVRNYEKGIKRLRGQAYGLKRYKDRVQQLENLVLDYCCFYDLDECAKNCSTYELKLHGEGREIRKKRAAG